MSLIKKHAKTGEDNNPTHILLEDESRYEVESDENLEFHIDYAEAVAKGQVLSLAELPQKMMPVVLDLSMSFAESRHFERGADSAKPYSDGLIFAIVHHIQQQMLRELTVSPASKELICCFLESPPFKRGDDYRIDIRFHFPLCRVDAQFQRKTLLPKIVERFRDHNVLAKFAPSPKGGWDNIIRYESFTTGLLMYGSVRDPDDEPMRVRCVLSSVQEDLNVDRDHSIMDLRDAFSPDDHSNCEQGIIERGAFSRANSNVEHWLHVILSAEFRTRFSFPRSNRLKAPNLKNVRNPQYNIASFGNGNGNYTRTDKLQTALLLIEMWRNDRILDYHQWNSIGEALYDAADGSLDGNKAWIEITDRALDKAGDVPSFLEEVELEDFCTTRYHLFEKERVTIKTLAWHAREDSKDLYEKWHLGWCQPAMEEAVDCHHIDVAEALYRTYWLEYVCCPGSREAFQWYEFRDHRLNTTYHGVKLLAMMSIDFIGRFLKMRTAISKLLESAADSDKSKGEAILAKISKLVNELKNVNFQAAIMRAASVKFMQQDLEKNIGFDPDIMGVKNGVIVATSKGIYHRPGRPQDYLVKSTKCAYLDHYHWNHPEVNFIMKWFRQVFHDADAVDYFLLFLASLFRGGNNDKIFMIWSGILGNNSKSRIVKLFEMIFGEYCAKVPVTVATSSRSGDGNGPTPAMARMEDTRICFFEESEKGRKLNEALINQMTGDDTYYARYLHSNGKEVDPRQTIVLICNYPPGISGGGGDAIRNRLVNMPFNSVWKNDAPESEDEQTKQRCFKIDPNFKEQIKKHFMAACWIGIQKYDEYLRIGLSRKPKAVIAATLEYWDNNDEYNQFIADTVSPVYLDEENKKLDASYMISVGELYEAFKYWHKDCFPQTRVPDRMVFKGEISRKWGLPSQGFWSGFRLRQENNHSAAVAPY